MAAVRNDNPEDIAPVPAGRGRYPRARIIGGAIAVAFLVAVVATAWYLNSDMFRERVRRVVVEQLETATGGRVELASLRWNLSRLEAEVTDLTIHGLEGPDEIPYAHVDRLYVRLKILSLMTRQAGIRDLSVSRPVIHIVVYPDGTTNQPEPKVKKQGGDPIQTLFDLSIERAEIKEGLLIWNHRRVPFDLTAGNLSAGMTYATADNRYDGTIHAGKIDAQMQNMRPFSAQAEAQFSLFRDRAQLKSLKASTGRTRVEASGSMTNFKQPRFDLAYNATIDLAEAGSIARVRQVRGGTLDLHGKGNYSLDGFASTGKVILKNATLDDASIHLRNVAAGADFSLDQDRISIPHLFATALGGTVTGEAQIEHWMATPPAIAKKRGEITPPQQRGTANLKLTGLPLSEITAALSSRKLPLDELNAAGVAAGTVAATWRGSPANAAANVDLTITPPASPAPRQLPVTASIRGMYHGANSSLRIDDLSMATPRSTLTAAGSLGRTTGNVSFKVATSNLGEFAPVIDAMRGPGPMPVELAGTASFDGTASGSLKALSVAGHLEVRDFTTVLPRGTAPPQAGPTRVAQTTAPAAPAQTVRMHWDLLSADVAYSPQQASVRNGVLRRAGAQIDVDGAVQLRKGKYNQFSPIDARLRVIGADVAELQSIAGYNYPVTGRLDVNLRVSGTQADPRGNGRVALTNATAYGQPIRSLTTDISLQNREAQLRNILLSSDLGQVNGAAAYNLGSEAFRFDLHGGGIQLAKVPQANRPNLRATGVLTFDASGSGTADAPVVNANLRLRDLTVNGKTLGDLDAEAVTKGSELRLTARSNMQDANLHLDGTVSLRGQMPGQAVLTLSSADLNPLLKGFVRTDLTGKTAISARVEASGPMKNPKAMRVEAVVDRLSTDTQGVFVQNQGPIRVRVVDQVATIEQFRMAGEGNRFLTVGGTVELAGARRLNLKAGGDIHLKILQTFNPNIMSGGFTDFDLVVGGTIPKPAVEGQINIRDGAVALIDLPNGLSNVNGSLVFTENRLEVRTLNARTGGGDIALGGFVTFDRGVAFHITAKGRDIRVRYPEGMSSTANADLLLSGTMKNALLSGEVTVTRFAMNSQFDLSLYLARSKQPPTTPKPDSLLNNVNFDIHVSSTPELRVQTSLAKISGNVDIRVRGTATRPAILGRVSIVEGDMLFNGTKYHLERGDVIFTNPVRIAPILNIEASARVRDYDITLGFHGPVDKLSTNYRSDPPLPSGDIIALLALGRTREEAANPAMMANGQPQQTFTESASNALLGQALNATVSSRVQKIFGISRVKIDPQVGGPENNANARMTVEQQISNKITLTYITNLTQSAQQIIQVEYNVNRNLSIIAVRDQNGIVGFDVRLRQRKK